MILLMQKDRLREAFSKRLIEALDDLGVPVRERAGNLARWVRKNDKNPEFARKWLKGLSMPQKDNMTVVSAKLGVREEWLEYGVGDKVSETHSKPTSHNVIAEADRPSYDISQSRKDVIDAAMMLNESDYEQLAEFSRYLLWKRSQG